VKELKHIVTEKELKRIKLEKELERIELEMLKLVVGEILAIECWSQVEHFDKLLIEERKSMFVVDGKRRKCAREK